MGRFLKLFEKPPPKVEPPLEQAGGGVGGGGQTGVAVVATASRWAEEWAEEGRTARCTSAATSASTSVAPPEQVWKVNSENAAGVAAVVGFGALRAVGEASGGLRRGIEAVDFFVGRYLLLTTVGYVGLKFVHYKLFDPFP